MTDDRKVYCVDEIDAVRIDRSIPFSRYRIEESADDTIIIVITGGDFTAINASVRQESGRNYLFIYKGRKTQIGSITIQLPQVFHIGHPRTRTIFKIVKT